MTDLHIWIDADVTTLVVAESADQVAALLSECDIGIVCEQTKWHRCAQTDEFEISDLRNNGERLICCTARASAADWAEEFGPGLAAIFVKSHDGRRGFVTLRLFVAQNGN